MHYSPKEQCAFDEMKLAGINRDDGLASGMGYGYNQPTRFSTVRMESTTVRCDLPQSPEDKAEIQRIRASMVPKAEYNRGIKGKQFLTGVGYFFYIVPGVVLKIYYDQQYDEALNESAAIYRSPASVP